MASEPYTDLLSTECSPKQLLETGLRLLEADLRERALLALADWEQQVRLAMPELVWAVGALRRPSWGHWNGLLQELRKARTAILQKAIAEQREAIQTLAGRQTAGVVLPTGESAPPRIETLIEWFAQAAEALAVVHQVGLVHRDVKPSNLMVTTEGKLKLMDFGIARSLAEDRALRTRTRQLLGTPTYMSPEQLQARDTSDAEAVGPASDVYSLCATFYQLFSGQLPPAPAPLGEMGAPSALGATLPRATRTQLARELVTLLEAGISPQVASRPGSMDLLAQDLRRIQRNEPIVYKRPSWARRFHLFYRRQRGLVNLVSIFLILSLMGIVGYILTIRAEQTRTYSEKIRADQQRDLAVDKARENNSRLDRQYVSNAERQFAQGDWMGALPWLTEACKLQEQEHGPRLQTHLVRLGLLFRNSPRLIQAWPRDGSINDVAFSHDGRLLATANEEGTARVRDVRTGAAISPPLKHDFAVLHLSFSPDDKRLLTTCGADSGRRGPGNACIWDVRTGQQVACLRHRVAKEGEFPGDQGQEDFVIRNVGLILAARFDPTGSRVVTASDDGTARVWDSTTGKALGEPLQHTGSVSDACFSPNGDLILTASEDKTAVLWNANSHAQQGKAFTHEGGVSQAKFSPDGNLVLTVCGKEAFVWERDSGRLVSKITDESWGIEQAAFSPDARRVVFIGSGGIARVWDIEKSDWAGPRLTHPSAHQVAFSPDGRWVLTVGEGVHLWEPTSGQNVMPFLSTTGTAAVFNPDGDRVATVDRGAVCVWDLAAAQADVLPFPPGKGWEEEEESLGPDGLYLAAISSKRAGGGYAREVRFFNLPRAEMAASPFLFIGGVPHVAFSRDGRLAAVVSATEKEGAGPQRGSLFLLDLATGQRPLLPLDLPGGGRQAAFSPDRRLLAVACLDGRVRVYEVGTNQEAFPPLVLSHSHTWANFSGDGRWLLTADDDGEYSEKAETRVWDAQTGQPTMSPLVIKTSVRGLLADPQGRRLFVRGDRGIGVITPEAWLVDIPSGRLLRGPFTRDLDSWPQFASDGRRFFLGEEIRGVEDGSVLGTLEGKVLDIAQRDKRCLVVCANGKEVRVRDGDTGDAIIPPLMHSGNVVQARLSPDTFILSTLAQRSDRSGEESPGGVFLWDARTGEQLSPVLSLPVGNGRNFLQFSPDGQRLTAVTLDSVRSLELKSESRALEGLSLLATTYSGNCIDATGGYVPVPFGEISNTLAGEPAHPERARAEALRWNQAEAAASEADRNWYAAVWHLEKVIEQRPDDPDPLGSLADAYGQQGQWDKAGTAYGRLLELGVKESWLWEGRGESEIHRKLWKDACADFTKAIEGGKAVVTSWLGRGVAQAELGQSEAARADLDKATRECGIQYAQESLSRAAKEHEKAENWPAVVVLLDALLDRPQLVPLRDSFKKPDGLAHRGHARLMLGQWQQAVSDYTDAIQAQGDTWWVRADRAVANAVLGKSDEVTADLRAAVAAGENADEVWKRTIEDLSPALEKTPEDPNLYAVRGRLQGTFGHNTEAQADLSRSLEKDDSDYSVWRSRASARCKLEQWDEAGLDFVRAVDKGASPEQVGQDAAARLADEAQKKPDDAVLQACLGLAYAWAADWSKAEAEFDRALGKDGKQPWALAGRGLICLRKKDLDGAAANLEQAHHLAPDEPLPCYLLAKLYAARAAAQPTGLAGDKNRHKNIAQALNYLETAGEHGFANWKEAVADKDLELLRSEPDFQKLIKER